MIGNGAPPVKTDLAGTENRLTSYRTSAFTLQKAREAAQQAAVAARLLKARIFCPIHYGQFNNPDTYRQVSELERCLYAAVEREGVSLVMVVDGETLLDA